MDHFNKLHPLIKFMIAIPIIVLILAVFIQTSRKDRRASNTQTVFIPNEDAQKYGSPEGPESLTNSFFGGNEGGLDLETSQICSYVGDDMKVEAQIKNKQVYATIDQKEKINNILVTEDCLYQWEDEQTSGVKICEIGQYVSMLSMFSSFLSPSTMLSSIPGLGSSMSIPEDAVTGILDSCEESEVDASLFEVPSSISFQEKSIKNIQPTEE